MFNKEQFKSLNVQKFKTMSQDFCREFPHILRKITAKIVVFQKNSLNLVKSLAPERKQKLSKFLPLFFLLGYLLFLGFYPESEFEKTRALVVKNPRNPDYHFRLAKHFQQNNQNKEALKEINIAIGLSPQLSYINEKEKIVKQINQPAVLKKELEYWHFLSQKFPNYRDAFWKKATLEYQLKDFFSATKNLSQVLKLDPNFESGLKLKKILVDLGYQVY